MSTNFSNNSFLYGQNVKFIEELYEKYLNDPNSVNEEWHKIFSNLPSDDINPSWVKKRNWIVQEASKTGERKITLDNENISHNLINSTKEFKYRIYGHLMADLDPLKIITLQKNEDIDVEYDEFLHKIYSSSIGAEFDQIQDFEEKNWLYDNFEKIQNIKFSSDDKKYFLSELIKIETLEQFLHKKFPGAKRFSAEGGDASVLATNILINESSNYGVNEIIIGMAHRGRLNTLTNVMGKPYRALLSEFLGKPSFGESLSVSGDVKYHMGFSNDVTSRYNKQVHLSLTPNPSHLEAVNTVVAGRVRAKQDISSDIERSNCLGILIHGDSAFCGQGIVAEGLSMSPLKAYNVGGILHLVINNQVGFTATEDDTHPLSKYSTEFGKITSVPILHVNGNDIEAVVRCSILASMYRNKYKKDFIIEIICYRKYGHNEGDEPLYTQPLMYKIIKDLETPAQLYAKSENLFEYYDNEKNKFNNLLEEELKLASDYNPTPDYLEGFWKGYKRALSNIDLSENSGFPKSKLLDLIKKLCEIPDNFNINSKLKKLFDARIESAEKNEIDWATAEQLAFASLLTDGYPVRLTGQDAERGTFSHRHSVLHDQISGKKYIPLNNLGDKQASFEVCDSNLSEYGVLGFEFGYSMTYPNSLVIWEAQFGDFSNGAQIIFDQFISSSETKWLRLSGLTILLPHGYEGQGPEHSSARLERLLQSCAEENMVVAYPTTPASIFHLLRKQITSHVRRPLIIMSPKSLLRHKLVISELSEFDTDKNFRKVIPEIDDIDPKKVKKIVICSGKIYYDLLTRRREKNINDVVIIRLEQLYPFPLEELNIEIKKYSNFRLFWVQEEPRNMGAYEYIYSRYKNDIISGEKLEYIGRKESASPAVGYLSVHNKEQEEILEKVFK